MLGGSAKPPDTSHFWIPVANVHQSFSLVNLSGIMEVDSEEPCFSFFLNNGVILLYQFMPSKVLP